MGREGFGFLLGWAMLLQTAISDPPIEHGAVAPRFRPGGSEGEGQPPACMEAWSERGDYLTAECRSLHRSMPTFQTGSLTVGRSRYSPMRSFTHSFRKPFGGMPRVIATAFGESGCDMSAGCNDTFAVTVKRVDRASFSANVYRVDQSLSSQQDGWTQQLQVSYVAWDEDADQPSGTEWASWNVGAVHPARDTAPWRIDETTSAEDAAYGGGRPERIRVDFRDPQRLTEVPRVLAAVRLTSHFDTQACFSSTVHAVDKEGFTLSLVRLDQTWQYRSLAIDYVAWEPSLATVPSDMYPPSARSVGGTGSIVTDPSNPSTLPPVPVQDDKPCATCSNRRASRVLDPYVLPKAQFGTHTLRPPVPTTAGFGEYAYPDSRWGSGNLAAGHGYGVRGQRLPSSVRYHLGFNFKDIFPERTPFNFSTVPLVVVSLRTFRDLIPEHQQYVSDTLAVSVVSVTEDGFTVNLFRTDRDGTAPFDFGGRGWLQGLDLDWLAWEPWYETHTDLTAETPVPVSIKEGELKYFRVLVTNDASDLLLGVSQASPSVLARVDDPTSSGTRRGIVWLKDYVRMMPGPPPDPLQSHLIIELPAPRRLDASLVPATLHLLNEGLLPGVLCSGGTHWSEVYNIGGVWNVPPDCAGDLQGSKPWPYERAYAFSEGEHQWYEFECAGAGCPHDLPSSIDPVQIIASTEVTYPGKGLARRVLGGEHDKHVWTSEVMRGSKELRVYATDPNFRTAYYYVALLGLTNVDLTLTAFTGRLTPAGPNGTEDGLMVPYNGHMSVAREYGGSVASGEWAYFRVPITAHDISSQHAITEITVSHGFPTEELEIYLGKGFAPNVAETWPVAPSMTDFATNTFASDTDGWLPLASSFSTCGTFGSILGGFGKLGAGAKVEKVFNVPRKHSALRLRLLFVKIDAWTGASGKVYVDGVLVWEHRFECQKMEKGFCVDVPAPIDYGGGVFSAAATQQCGAEWSDQLMSIDITFAHEIPTVFVEVTTDLDGSDPDQAWWGIGNVIVSYLDQVRTLGMWVDQSSSLYATDNSVPPSDILDFCTPRTTALSPGCVQEGVTRTCTGGTRCSRRSVTYRLTEAHSYFVGVYGRTVTSTLPFTIRVHVGSREVWGGQGAGREPTLDFEGRRRGKPLMQTYARVSVAHGVGVSVGVIGIPATFYIRSKDKYGNLQNSGGDPFEISFTGPCGVDQQLDAYADCKNVTQPTPTSNIVDIGRGDYLGMYTLTRGGVYNMQVTLRGIHIRGSPFTITMEPDATALQAATGSLYNTSHRDITTAQPVQSHAFARMYKYFVADVPDMTADLIVDVEPETGGEVDVFVSNTQSHPVSNIPADVQWRSESATLVSGNSHRIHIRYGDPLFLAGLYYIGVYGVKNSSFTITATTEQVAREVSVGVRYGGVTSSLGSCTADSDCASHQICHKGLCSSALSFRYSPTTALYSHLFTIEVAEDVLSQYAMEILANCSTLSVYLTRTLPYPNGTLIVQQMIPDETPSTAITNDTCRGRFRYSLTLKNEGCQGSVQVSDNTRSLAVCTDPIRLGSDYYLTVISVGGVAQSWPYTLFITTLSRDKEPDPSAAEVAQKTGARVGSYVLQNITALSHSAVISDSVKFGQYLFYVFPGVNIRNELQCNASSVDGLLILFMSTTDVNPMVSRAGQIHWRSDTSWAGSSSVSLHARPTDAGFSEGDFFISVYGFSSASFDLQCSLSESAVGVPSVYVGRVFGGKVWGGMFKTFRLKPTSAYKSVKFTVELSPVNTTQVPLSIYIQKDVPSYSAATLPACSGTVTMNCFESDVAGMITPSTYRGISSTQAVLEVGSVYYIGVEGTSAEPSVEISFTLSISSE